MSLYLPFCWNKRKIYPHGIQNKNVKKKLKKDLKKTDLYNKSLSVREPTRKGDDTHCMSYARTALLNI